MTQEDWEYLKKYLPEEIRHEIVNICLRNLLSDVEKDQLIFWIIWEWSIKQEWRGRLMGRISFEYKESSVEGEITTYYIHSGYIDPDRFPQLVVDFLREKEG